MKKRSLSVAVEEYGIKETSEMLAFIVALLNVFFLIDLKNPFASLGDLFSLVPAARSGVEGFGDIDQELVDLDDEEESELAALITERLQLKTRVSTRLVRDLLRLTVLIAKVAGSIQKATKKDDVNL